MGTSSTERVPPARLLTLDAMRGLASIIVVLFHLQTNTGLVLSAFGYLAVDFFFLLSGFVIARAYEVRLATTMPFQEFAAIRFARLYPLFLIGMAVGTIRCLGQIIAHRPEALSPGDFAVALLFNTAMLPCIVTLKTFPINAPAWSLFLELAVNAVYAFAITRGAGRRHVGTALVVWGCLLVLAGASAKTLNGGWSWPTLYIAIARVGYSFTLGVYLARRQLRTLDDSWKALWPVVLLVGCLEVPLHRVAGCTFDLAFALVLSPALLVYGIRYGPPRRLHGMCRFLGDASYALYAFHEPLRWMFGYAAQKLRLPDALWMPAYVVMSLMAAGWLARRYDPGMRNRLRRWLERKPAVAQIAPLATQSTE